MKMLKLNISGSEVPVLVNMEQVCYIESMKSPTGWVCRFYFLNDLVIVMDHTLEEIQQMLLS